MNLIAPFHQLGHFCLRQSCIKAVGQNVGVNLQREIQNIVASKRCVYGKLTHCGRFTGFSEPHEEHHFTLRPAFLVQQPIEQRESSCNAVWHILLWGLIFTRFQSLTCGGVVVIDSGRFVRSNLLNLGHDCHRPLKVALLFQFSSLNQSIIKRYAFCEGWYLVNHVRGIRQFFCKDALKRSNNIGE